MESRKIIFKDKIKNKGLIFVIRFSTSYLNFRNCKSFATLVLLSIIFFYFFLWKSKTTRSVLLPNYEMKEMQQIAMLKKQSKKTTIKLSFSVSKSSSLFSRSNTYSNKSDKLHPSDYADKHATFVNENFTKTTNPITRTTATCPPHLELNREYQKEWYVKNHRPVSPFTLGRFELQNETVVILTPISNIADKIQRYFQILCSLTYPKRLISVVLGEDSSREDTYAKTKALVDQLQGYYRRVSIIQLSGRTPVSNTGDERHASHLQKQRRVHLANARNELLRRGLGSEDWALWLDSDLHHVPENLIEHMLSTRKDVVAANSLYAGVKTRFETYDKNTWRETSESLRHLDSLADGELMIEGYGETKRKYLYDLRGEGAVVRLDGVGGCALLVNASLHKRGLEFPNYAFHHHIETEGLAKMAAVKYNVQIYGLPFVTIVHL